MRDKKLKPPKERKKSATIESNTLSKNVNDLCKKLRRRPSQRHK